MSVTKSARDAIEEFVEAIAQHYLAVQAKSRDADHSSVAEEFVSAIESDLRSTLRDRLSQLETARHVELAPTTELSASAVGTGASRNGPDVGQLDATIGSEVDIEAVTQTRGSNPAEIDTPTMDADAINVHRDSDPIVRPGRSGRAAGLSYDKQPAVGSGKRLAGGTAFNHFNARDAPPGYEILSTLGKGGMGIVYKARHVPLNRMVAVKMIISGANASDDQLARFQREAEAAAHLKHPNIVSVYEVGLHHGLPYFSLEFVDGNSLSEMMRETTLSPRHAAELLIPVARAVHYSHQMGVLHRDLKPQNILLTEDGQPKVADFGLAKRLDVDDDENKTREGVILGTPGYMAPEQARNSERVGPHTDVYALGSILYYMMTGRPPFAAPTPFEVVRQLLLHDPLAPSKLQAGLDRDLETICLKSLEKEIDKRYATAGEFADELQRFVDGEPIIARPITRRERVWKWCRRNPRVATLTGLAASLLFCLLLGGIISAIVINKQKKAEQTARQQAETNEQRAKEQGALAADFTRLLLYKTRDFFDQKPELRELREPLMEAVVGGAEKIYTQNDKYNVNEVFTASADLQLGQIYLNAGSFQKARDKLVKAERQLVKLRAEGNLFNADVSQMNIDLAMGDTYRYLGEMDKAEMRYLSLEKRREEYFRSHPEFGKLNADASMAEAYGKLATIYRLLGKPDKALDYNLKTVAIRREGVQRQSENEDALAELAGSLSQLSSSYEGAGETEKMLATSSEALGIQMQLAERRSDLPTRHNTAKDQKTVARQYLLLNKNSQAQLLLDSATGTLEKLIKISDDQRIHNQAIDAFYWQGITLQRLGQDASASFRRAEQLQRQMIEKSDNVHAQGMLLKILAAAGEVDRAIPLADQLAESNDKMMNCGYAAAGYGLISQHLADDDARKAVITTKAIELTRQLIRHGYHDFESMRKTDLDFAPLQQNEAFLKMLSDEEDRIKESSSGSIE